MFFDLYEGGERAVIVQVNNPSNTLENTYQEFGELVKSAGLIELDCVEVNLRQPSSRFFIGEGKVQEISQLVLEYSTDAILFNCNLSASQERNLEAIFNCKVIDRTGLILDIFAQRARTFEGKLQVELAQLEHLSTRLIRGWTHLERQKGGIGLRGPGETQLETDRRLLKSRVKKLQKRLEKVRSQRKQGRHIRQKSTIPTIVLVGYTNAGKSTLFNQLTSSTVYVKDQLFATLDTTLRQISCPTVGQVAIADTVGFIRDLPHKLIKAFRATLEEAVYADLLLHVIDVNDPHKLENIAEVQKILMEIGADKIPQIKIYNKIDLLDHIQPNVIKNDNGNIHSVRVSAKRREDMELILASVSEALGVSLIRCNLFLNSDQGKVRSTLYKKEYVKSESYANHGLIDLEVCMPKYFFDQILKKQDIHHKQVFFKS